MMVTNQRLTVNLTLNPKPNPQKLSPKSHQHAPPAVADNISVTDLTVEDLPEIHRVITLNRESLHELGWLSCCLYSQFDVHYRYILTSPTLRVSVIRVDGEVAGMFEVDDRGTHYYIGYWLAKQFRGRGIITEIVKSHCELLIQTKTVTADTLLENISSQNVLKRAGFQEIAQDDTHGYWVRRA